MLIYRTHDGRAFQVAQSLNAFDDRAELVDAIAIAVSIPSDDLICMTGTGQQLTEDVFDRLQEAEARPSGSRSTIPPHDLYVFNRQFLYSDLDGLVQELEESALLQSPAQEPDLVQPPTPRSLEAILAWSQHLSANIAQHAERSETCLSELDTINRGTKIALANLLSHADTVCSGAEALQLSAAKELERMDDLLKGHATSLKILSFVQIHPKLLPLSSDSKARTKERNLADYVSPTKMDAVYHACSDVYRELQDTQASLRADGAQLADDTEGLRKEVESTSTEPSHETYQESAQALPRAQALQQFLVETCAPDEHGWPATDKLSSDSLLLGQVEETVGELILLDEVMRESLRRLIADKNDMMARSLHLLSDISSLQSEHADLGVGLSQLDADFRSNRTDGFRHLARLRNMLWAYGSTLIEIHRRREFGKRFLTHSQALAEVMASYSETETRRRQEFRSRTTGALPWEVKGIEDATPNLEISTGRTASSNTSDIDQVDVDSFFQLLDTIETELQGSGQTKDVIEVRAAAQRLIASLDDAEAEFTRLVEVTLLEQPEDSGSEAGNDTVPTHRSGNRDKQRPEKDLQVLRMEHAERERQLAAEHDRETAQLRTELGRTRADLRSLTSQIEQGASRNEELKRSLEAAKSEAETEHARRVNMEEELRRLREEAETARQAEKAARAEANDEGERISDLEGHLHDLQEELEGVKEAREDASNRIESLLSKGSTIEQELNGAQERIDELTQQLGDVRSEMRDAREALHEAETARDKLLRNYRAEADGDRAILEESLRTKAVELEKANDRLRRHEIEVAEHVDSVKNLQSQLSAADEAHEELVHQLETTKEASMDADMARRHAERTLDGVMDNARALALGMIGLSENLERVPLPNSAKMGSKTSSMTNMPSVEKVGETERTKLLEDLGKRDDGSSTDTLLEAMTWLSKTDPGDAAIKKLESLATLCKKWMKAYKYANDKAQKQQITLREKITFRNFTIGDLALFLPTRSSPTPPGTAGVTHAGVGAAKPWAAFNINCPHYFLNFSGRPENEKLRDSLRQKEWIVARIVNIESRIASPLPSSMNAASLEEQRASVEGNPFQLAEGVRYFLLDVENWNLANSSVGPGLPRRKSSVVANETTNGNTHGFKVQEAPDRNAGFRRETQACDPPLPDHPVQGKDETQAEAERNYEVSTGRQSPSTARLLESQSALTLALHRRSSSSETPKRQENAVPESIAPGSVSTTGPSAARWPMPADRAIASPTAGSTSSNSSLASNANALRLLDGSSAPAFSRNKRVKSGYRHGSEGEASAPQKGAAATSQGTRGGDGEGARPLNVVQRALRRSSGLDDALNPFSSSPAPAVESFPWGETAAQHGLSKQSKSGSKTEDEAVDIPGRGKGKEPEALYNCVVDNGHGNQRSTIHRRSSHSSQVSVASRLSSLHIKSRSGALSSPRLRSQATLEPSVSMETAHGQSMFGRTPAQERSPSLGSQRSAGDGSGFSQVAGTSAGRMSAGVGGGGSSAFLHTSLRSMSGAAAATSAAQGAGPGTPSSSPNTRITSAQTVSSPPSNRRRTSLFGGAWALGPRKSGTGSDVAILGRNAGSSASNAASSSISSPFVPPLVQEGSTAVSVFEAGKGDSSSGSADPAAVPNARQSLRRLASTSR